MHILHANKAGLALLNPHTEEKWCQSINSECGTILANIKAIEMCVNKYILEDSVGKRLIIVSESEEALRKINANGIDSLTTKKCLERIKIFSEFNTLSLVWFPRKNRSLNQLKTLEMAEKASGKTVLDLKLPVNSKKLDVNISNWENQQCLARWQIEGKNLQASYQMIKEPFCGQFSKSLLENSRTNIRQIIACLTNHAPTIKLLKVIGKTDNSKCRLCKRNGSEENMKHFLQDCTRTEGVRRKYNIKWPLCLSEDIKEKFANIIGFLDETGIKELVFDRGK